jgi:hypothetical protein
LNVKSWTRRLLERIGLISPTEIVAILDPDYPDAAAMPAGVLYVVGDKTYRKWAYFKCPCGCGAPIMLSLSAKRRPHWSVKIDWLDRPTIKPSVWQTDGCYSHFWVQSGHIEWTSDTGRPPPGS